jgi:apolipoprotein D and lipocalin family protein
MRKPMNIIRFFKVFLLVCVMIILNACLFSSDNGTEAIPAVKNVDLNRYAGKWYEIARIDHSFEKGLTNVTATYTLMPKGKVRVVNEGYDSGKSGEKKTAVGKAWLPDPSQPGRLKVSFFLFFGASYKIIALDEEKYSFALVTSDTKDYAWILSRTPQMDQALYNSLLAMLKSWGFKTELVSKVPQEWGS